MRRTTLALLLFLPLYAGAGTYVRGDLRHRPRLTFDGRDTAHVQRMVARIDARQEPWASGYAALRNLVDRGGEIGHQASGWRSQSDSWLALYGQETRNGEIAAARAMVVWLWTQGLDPAWRPLPTRPGESTPAGWAEDQAHAARRTLEGMYDDWPCWRGFKVVNRGIVAADSLAMHCVAYDLLAALPQSMRGGLGVSEHRLGDLASDLRYWFWVVNTYNSNHDMRVAAGLGMAAVALNRHDRYRWWKPETWWHRPAGWLKKADRSLSPTRRRSDLLYQGSTGAYAEGSTYYHYAADLYLPFFFAHENFQRGRGTRFLRADVTTDLALWSLDLRLPDGRRAQVDNARLFHDSTPGYFLSRLGGGVRSAADRDLLLWDYAQSGFPGIGGRRASFLLSAFDPTDAELSAALASPGPGLQPTRYMPQRGGAVLRTGWGPSAAHVLVQAQQGKVRKRGKGHESVANGAFAFFAHGDQVTIDPGYFGFSQVEKTHRGEHRSMVLVDGEAPRPAHKILGFAGWTSGGTDTHLITGPRTQAGAEVRSVEVSTSYAKADIRRTLALVGTRYLLVEDRCRSSRKTRTFTTQVQTNAGAAKSRPLTVQGSTVRYETNRKRLSVCVGASAGAPLTTQTEARESSTGEGPNGHDAIIYSARGREETFLLAVAVEPAGNAAPSVEGVSVSGARVLRIESGGSVDVAVSNVGGGRVSVPALAGTQAFTTDHALTIVSFDAAGTRRVVWTVGPGQVR